MAIFAENGANMEIDLTIEQTGPHEAIPYELLYEADPSREPSPTTSHGVHAT